MRRVLVLAYRTNKAKNERVMKIFLSLPPILLLFIPLTFFYHIEYKDIHFIRIAILFIDF